MSAADWAGFALAILLIELTPGPNMAWLAALSLGQGRRAGLAAVAGIGVGLFMNALAAGFGVAALVTAQPALWQLLRWGGVGFMLWLAWESWREVDRAVAAAIDSNGLRRPFYSGLVVNLLNPKALLFFVVLIPQYLGGDAPAPTLVAAISLASVTIATIVHLAIVYLGGAIAPWLANGDRTRPVRRLLALSLVVVALWFAFGASPPV